MSSEMKRLLELAERRSRESTFKHARVRLPAADNELLRKQLDADGITMNELFNAIVRGYLLRHPAVLAMLDDEFRSKAKPEKKHPSLSKRDVDEIYAEIGSGVMDGADDK